MNPRKQSKKWSWIALAALALITFGAYTTVTADVGHEEEQATGQGVWQHMTEMRDIMHLARVEAQPLENGVQVAVTSEDAALEEAIGREFTGERHEPAPPAPGVAVQATAAGNGVVIAYTSADPATVRWLRARGEQLVYNELRENMHNLMSEQGWPGRRGFGHMGGWMHGPGWGKGPGEGGWMRGPGWMHGPRGEGGYGPGPRGQGGYGPGWMHGPGGYGPANPDQDSDG